MSKPDLESSVNNSFSAGAIGNRFYRNIRNPLLLAYVAYAAACSDGGPTGPDNKPGKPTARITASPPQGMSPLEVTISPSGDPGKLNSIKTVWLDYNADNTPQSDEISTSVPPQTSRMFYHDGSNNPVNQKIIRLVLTNDKNESARDSATVNVTRPPQTFQYQVTARDGRTTQPISGATITSPEVAGINAVTGIDGKVTITSQTDLKGKRLTFSAQGYEPFGTYLANSPDGNMTSYLIGTDINSATGRSRIDSFNQTGRGSIDGINCIGVPFSQTEGCLTIRWAPNSNPRYGIYPEGVDNETKGFATDVMKNDMELGAPGGLKNATNPEILIAPIDSIGAITVQHGDSTQNNGTRYYLVDYQIVGLRVFLTNGIFRGAASHELAGHGGGQQGHQPSNVLSVMSAQVRNGFEPIDIENAAYLYRRTYGSARRDMDKSERPLTTSGSNFMAPLNSANIDLNKLRIIEIRDRPDGTLETVILKEPTSSASIMQSNAAAARIIKSSNNYRAKTPYHRKAA